MKILFNNKEIIEYPTRVPCQICACCHKNYPFPCFNLGDLRDKKVCQGYHYSNESVSSIFKLC